MFDRSQFDLDAPRVHFYHNTTRLYETDPTTLHETICAWCATQGWTAAAQNAALHMCTQSGLAPVYRQKFHELQTSSAAYHMGDCTDRDQNVAEAEQPTIHLIDAGAQRVVLHDDKGDGSARIVVCKPFLVLPDTELEQAHTRHHSSPYGALDRGDNHQQLADTRGTRLELQITLAGTDTPDVKWLGPHTCAAADVPPPERSGCLDGFRVCGMPVAGVVGIPLLTSVLVCAALLVDRG